MPDRATGRADPLARLRRILMPAAYNPGRCRGALEFRPHHGRVRAIRWHLSLAAVLHERARDRAIFNPCPLLIRAHDRAEARLIAALVRWQPPALMRIRRAGAVV